MNERNDALARARSAALEELRRSPKATSWRRSAAVIAGAAAGTSALALLAALFASLTSPGELLARAPWLATLVGFGAAAGVAAIAPRRGVARTTALVVAFGLMAVLVVSRGAGVPSTTPGWVCSVSHFGLDLLPLAVALVVLRQAAWTWPRALTAGLGAGAAGALLGELACHQGARHVLVHHVGAWLLATAVCVLLSRRLRPQTFAP
jgi:hypothetical protein